MRAWLPQLCLASLPSLLGTRVPVAPGDDIYTRPGQIVVAADGARLNFYCMGSGSPTVIFDSGWEDLAPAWAVVPARDAQDPKHLEYEHQIALAQGRWLELSSNARQIFSPQSSEYIEFDQPDVVVSAIRDVYDLAK
jgi:hypothetical protein